MIVQVLGVQVPSPTPPPENLPPPASAGYKAFRGECLFFQQVIYKIVINDSFSNSKFIESFELLQLLKENCPHNLQRRKVEVENLHQQEMSLHFNQFNRHHKSHQMQKKHKLSFQMYK